MARRLATTLAALVGLSGAAAAPAQATIAFVGVASATTTTNTLTISKPSGTANGQVLVATVAGAGTATISAPSGWTLVQDTTSGATRQLTYAKVASSEPTSYAFTSTSARSAAGGITAYSGANGTDPIDASAEASGASGNAITPSATTSSANDLVISTVAFAIATTTTPASGTTERYDKSAVGVTSESADAAQAAVGASTARTVTPVLNTAAWSAQTIALRDATAAGLSLSTGTTASFSADLDAGDQTPTFTLPMTVTDTRTGASAGLGWNLTITSTQYATGSAALSTSASSVTGATATCADGGLCAAPTNATTYPVSVPAGATAPAAVKLASVAAGTGVGLFSMPATIAVTVPQNSFSGSYQSTLTVSIVSGP